MNLNIFSYERSTFFMINSDILGLIFICFSEKDFEIITFNKSSVGNSIPINTKLFVLDFKSSNLKEDLLLELYY